jgi:hypothetical protein
VAGCDIVRRTRSFSQKTRTGYPDGCERSSNEAVGKILTARNAKKRWCFKGPPSRDISEPLPAIAELILSARSAVRPRLRNRRGVAVARHVLQK